jgi:hypothetical protein
VSLRLLANFIVYLIDCSIVHLKLERLAIIGFARDHCSFVAEVHMNSNFIFEFKTKIWMRHSEISRPKLLNVEEAILPGAIVPEGSTIHQSAKEPAH